MQPGMEACAGATVRAALALTACALLPAATAGGAMPVAQQNALVQRYCAVCHNDAHVNGGLSLEHFDAAHSDPGVAAMLLSKLTSLSLEKVREAQNDPTAAALLARGMKNGAMGAAGVALPDRAAQNAWIKALSEQSVRASEWAVNRTFSPEAPILTASILQEAPSQTQDGAANLYRLTLTCDGHTHQGEMRLAWAPGVPPKGQALSAAVDRDAPVTYQVEGSEKMFRGATGTSGTGATVLYAAKDSSGMPTSMLPLPERTLTVRNVFPDETVVFPFSGLTQQARHALATCFTTSGSR